MTTETAAETTIVLINEDTVGQTIHHGPASVILDSTGADPALKAAVQQVVDGGSDVSGEDAEGCPFRVTLQSRQYRCYQTVRNAGGGLDGIGMGEDSEYISAATAQEAADEYAEQLREIDECEGVTVIATDDAGDSAVCDV